jgi:PAS domain S-box-containing protein
MFFVSVILFNLIGYYIILQKTATNDIAEEAINIVNEEQMLTQETAQSIVDLAVHSDFSLFQKQIQENDLRQKLVQLQSNHATLENLIRQNADDNSNPSYLVKQSFLQKQNYLQQLASLASHALDIHKEEAAHDHKFVSEVRSTVFFMQKVQHGLIKNLRERESSLEKSIRDWNRALLTSLFIALALIIVLITAPSLKENQKTKELAARHIRESERKYRYLFHSNPMPMWIYDLHTQRFLEANERACAHYGYSEQEFLSMTIFDIRPLEERQRLQGVLKEPRENKTSTNRGIWKHVKKTGDLIFVEVISHPIQYQDKEAVLVLAKDVTLQTHLQHQLKKEKAERQREIIKTTIAVQEKERHEIGKELHDNVNQVLTTAKLYLDHMGELAPSGEPGRKNSMNLIDTAIHEIRRLSRSLVPPALQDVGLAEAIEELVDGHNSMGTIHFEFETRGLREETLDSGLKLTVYRIVQEGTTNIIRYAEASRATIRLEQNSQQLRLVIEDNGIGFDPTARRKGVGLNNMIHRADVHHGVVQIITAPGKGCHLEIHFRHEAPKTNELIY